MQIGSAVAAGAFLPIFKPFLQSFRGFFIQRWKMA
jgi:hypothetical protein